MNDMGMGPQGFMDGMMDAGMGPGPMDAQQQQQNDMATPSPSFGNRQVGGMMDMAVQPPRNMEDMNRIYAVSKDDER